MRAVGYQKSLPITDEQSLQDIELPKPSPGGHDILVAIQAVSVNPVDTKVRKRAAPSNGQWKVLGWDAAGTVVEVGPDVERFKPGDHVFYAGALDRDGCNAEFHLIDERLVGHKPSSLKWAEAAAMPLTALTAWEMLYDRLDVHKPVPGLPGALLIVGGAGGVGSMAIQLGRQIPEFKVIASASRPETREWVSRLGAQHVIDHARPLAPQIDALGLGSPGFVFVTTQSAAHRLDVADLIAPQGRLGLIDDPDAFDILPFKTKSVSVHWELMYTRSLYATSDMGRQGQILDKVAELVDDGALTTTLNEVLGPINAEALRRAHQLVESGKARGKIVLEGFS